MAWTKSLSIALVVALAGCNLNAPTVDTATDSLGGSTIRLGTWNIRKLGHGTMTDFEQVARIVDANFDVIAVTEVMQKLSEGLPAPHNAPGYHRLLDTLEEIAPGEWSAMATESPRPNNTLGAAEYYAIFYRRTRVRACEGWSSLRYVDDHDGGSNASGAPLDLWLREPAFGCFEAGQFDFGLAAWHASYGSVPKTRQEAYHLTRVFDAMAAAIPGEEDLIIAGDFNLTIDELGKATSTWSEEWADVTDRTVDRGTTIRRDGTLTARAFDHLCVRSSASTNEMLGNAEPLTVYAGAEPGSDFYWTVSDHLPIAVRIDITMPDDDGPAREVRSDLVLTDVALGMAEASVDQVVQARAVVHNAGTVTAPRSQLEYVLSADSAWDGSDIYLNYDRVDALSPTEFSVETANLRMPDVAPGEYYVLFVPDANGQVDQDASNDVLAVPVTITGATTADLVIENASGPLTGRPDEQVSVSVTVRNDGSTAVGASRINYYFSTDRFFGGDIYRSYDRVSGLMTGEHVGETANVRIPEGTRPGRYYVLAVADIDEAIAESDEQNNIIAIPITVY